MLSTYDTPALRQTMFEAYVSAADVIAELIAGGPDAARNLLSKMGNKG